MKSRRNDFGRACGAYGRNENVYGILARKAEGRTPQGRIRLNPLNAELNPICHLLGLLGVHHIFHVSGLRVK
jgi:hypothetical protein